MNQSQLSRPPTASLDQKSSPPSQRQTNSAGPPLALGDRGGWIMPLRVKLLATELAKTRRS